MGGFVRLAFFSITFLRDLSIKTLPWKKKYKMWDGWVGGGFSFNAHARVQLIAHRVRACARLCALSAQN